MVEDACSLDMAEIVLALVSSAGPGSNAQTFLQNAGALLARTAPQIERVFVSLQTLHPAFRARTYLWEASEDKVRTVEWPHGLQNRPGYFESPDHHVHSSRTELRVRDLQAVSAHRCDLYGELRGTRYTDYLIVPLLFKDGTVNTLSAATRRAGGFQDAAIRDFQRLTGLFAIVLERFAALETVETALSTYLGRNAGQQVLRGKIRAGHGELVKAAILFADLHDFTSLTERLGPEETVGLLNDYFDCLVGPIEQHGGYVLKFIGDAVLGFFPVDVPDDPEPAPMAAAHAIRGRLTELNQVRTARNESPLHHGLCMHFGEVLYGNIGSSERLDFTIIGTTVNVAQRCLEYTRVLGADYLFTEAFARQFAVAGLQSVGAHRLRGVEDTVPLLKLVPN